MDGNGPSGFNNNETGSGLLIFEQSTLPQLIEQSDPRHNFNLLIPKNKITTNFLALQSASKSDIKKTICSQLICYICHINKYFKDLWR